MKLRTLVILIGFLVAVGLLGWGVWMAEAYVVVHREADSYGHEWTPRPVPGASMPPPARGDCGGSP